VPPLADLTLSGARAALEAAGFTVGTVTETTATTALPGTVVAPAGIRLELAGTPIDLVVARSGSAPQTRLALTIAAPQRVTLTKSTTVGVRLKVSKPARVTAVLRDAKQRRLYTWTFSAKPGANVVKLRLPARLSKPGTYSLVWIARSETETVSRTVTIRLVGPAQAAPKKHDLHVVFAGRTPAGDALRPGRAGVYRISTAADVDHTFDLIARPGREIGAAVVDADAFGTAFIADLRAVFPAVPVVAVSREPARRTQALRAGAALALPRKTTAAQLAKAIVRAAGR
jgi:hypothetical protein